MPARKKQVPLTVVDGIETPGTEVRERPVRRRFTAAYKARIVRAADIAPPGTVAALLRREGLYASVLQKWRREQKEQALESRKRGPKKNPLNSEVQRLRKENERLTKRLGRTEKLLDLQKKVAEILGVTLQQSAEDE